MVTYILLAVLCVSFVLDYFVFMPRGAKRQLLTVTYQKTRNVYNEALCMKASAIKKGQLWRLVTSLLLHGGLLHLLFNSLAFLAAGRLVEQQLGWWRYLILLAASGIFANLCNMRILNSEFSFGASLATHGVIGMLAAMLLINPQLLGAIAWPWLVYLAGYCLYNVVADKWNLVEHGGGFIAGVLLAFILL
jgi:rhomboid protease GluP